MPILKFFLIVAVLALFAFPGDVWAEMSVEKVAKKTKVREDKGDPVLDFKGPDINSLKHDPYYVRSFTDVEMTVATHFLIVEYDFLKAKGSGDSSIVQSADSLYKNFYTAVDGEGNEFELRVFHRDFDGCSDGNSFCSFEEYFRITIPDEYFREKAQTGITLYARSRYDGSMRVYLYPAYIQGILLRIEKEREGRGLN